MKIIITGGAGFIASHVADAYIAAGHKVAVIDNLATGFRRNLNPRAKFYKADIRDLALMEKIFRAERPDVVNHHAAIAEVVKSLRDPIPTLQVNVLGLTNVLVAFGKYGRGGKKRKFIFSSTGGAIIPPEGVRLPSKENEASVTLSPYGLSKLLGEEIIKFYARQYGFDYAIFRYPNVYGPRQNPKGEAGVVAIFGGLMKNALAKRGAPQATIFGDGTKSRDYTFVGDIASANVAVLRAGKRGGRNETINLGWGKKVTDNMIFGAVARATGYRGKPKYAPYRAGEVYQIALDARKAKRILGWTPKVKLDEGIRRAVADI